MNRAIKYTCPASQQGPALYSTPLGHQTRQEMLTGFAGLESPNDQEGFFRMIPLLAQGSSYVNSIKK